MAFILILFPVLLFGQKENSFHQKLASFKSTDKVHIWVYFKDKGLELNNYFSNPSTIVSEKSLKRRSKVLSPGNIVDITDLPVNNSYISNVEALGFQVKQRSRWFNAVSGYISKEDIPKIESLAFVKNLDFVQHLKSGNLNYNKEILDVPVKDTPAKISLVDYGPSFMQNNLINTVPLHNLGFTGEGITICLMDAGFTRYRTHEAFQTMNVIATWDFVNNNWGVDDSSDIGSGTHGTMTLSAIGGYKPGVLMGTAFGADFILAKTENTTSETPTEEDNWVAALEWADSIGVDVTSTSLIYSAFDTSFTSYTWENMDGNTTIITRAADLAVAKGIVVVNSAGNEGFNPSHNTLGAPADGDSVIAIGAVDSNKVRISYSSVGPTADGRIKPDVMALGNTGITASPFGDNQYSPGGGTSFACPLAAGAAACILDAHPDWTPMMIREALRLTANNHTGPNNQYGWGVIDAYAAYQYVPTGVSNDVNTNLSFNILQNYPNPFNPATTITFAIEKREHATLTIYNSIGQVVSQVFNDVKDAGSYSVTWNAEGLSSGIYFCELSTAGFRKTIKLIYLK